MAKKWNLFLSSKIVLSEKFVLSRKFVWMGCLTSSLVLFFKAVCLANGIEVPIKDNDRLWIQGWGGKVVLVGSSEKSAEPKMMKIKTTEDVFRYQIDKVEGGVHIEVLGPENKADWLEKKSALTLEIQSPPLSAEVSLYDGSLTAVGWKKDLFVTTKQGNIQLKNCAHSRITTFRGDVSVSENDGNLNIETYSGSISTKKTKGHLTLLNFAGDTGVAAHQGGVKFNGSQGALRVGELEGQLQFENQRGGVSVEASTGRMEGSTANGNIHIDLPQEADVKVSSKSGTVQVKVREVLGSYLNLSSEEGEIYVPNYLRVLRDTQSKMVKGKLKSSSAESKGQITVATDTGNIQIRAN